MRSIRGGLDSGADLVSYHAYLPGLSWYTRRRVRVNGGAGELAFGRDRLPDAERAEWFLDSFDDLARQLDRDVPTYCVVRSHEEAGELLGRLGPGAREIAWNRKRAILGNAAAAALTPALGRVGSARRIP